MPRKDPRDPVIATNRKAFRDYEVQERFEAGISLAGTEVKSCRERLVQLGESFARIENGEAMVYNLHIAAYGFGKADNPDAAIQKLSDLPSVVAQLVK